MVFFFSSISYTIIYIFLLNLSLPRTQTVLPTGFGFLFPLHQKWNIICHLALDIKQLEIVSLPNFPMLKKPIIATTHLLLQGGDWKHGRIGCDYSIVFSAIHHYFCCYVTENGSFCWTIEDQELFKAITVVLAADG